MDSPSRDNCAECGKTRSTVASITQWISLGDKCSCGAAAPKGNSKDSSKNLSQLAQSKSCPRCGGSLAKQSGSLTQWVLRSTPCKCGDQAIGEFGVRSFPAGTLNQVGTTAESGSLSEQEQEEIEIEAARFPKERYSPLSLIGSGQQGDVYKARDRLLGRLVCIKVLRTERLLPEQAVRFQREAQTGGKLTHPNLTTVLDFGLTEQGQPFLVMELCFGTPLSDLIQESGAIPVDIAMKLFFQICDGMQYAHDHGILHRDLKSSNILISEIDSEYPTVKVIDFGLSSMLDTMDDTGKITHDWLLMGTPAYMSPEQVQDQKLDERSDLYSFGCVMFETLTGKPLFEGETTMAVLNMHASATPSSLAEKAPHIEFSDELEQLVSELLEKDPSLRIQTMQELKKSLQIVSGYDFAESIGQTETDESPRSEGDMYLPLYSDYAETHSNGQVTSVATRKKNSKFLVAAGIALTCALLIVGAIVTGGAIVSEHANVDSRFVDFKKYELADGTWLIVSGNVHGENASKLEQLKVEPLMKIVDPKLSDRDLVYLEKLPLTLLDLSGTQITDSGLQTLTRIKTLQALIINDNKSITDAGMKTLKQMSKLRVIGVKATGVTDDGVSTLAEIPSLKSIDISHNKVTVKSLSALRKLPDLLGVRIGNTSIRADDLDVLKEFSGLRGLHVAQLGLRDSDMPKIAVLQRLIFLDVSGNGKLTRAGIEALNPGRFWKFRYSNCGLTKTEMEAMAEKLFMYTPAPIDITYVSEGFPKDMDRDLYAFWYSPKFADREYVNIVEETMTKPSPALR